MPPPGFWIPQMSEIWGTSHTIAKENKLPSVIGIADQSMQLQSTLAAGLTAPGPHVTGPEPGRCADMRFARRQRGQACAFAASAVAPGKLGDKMVGSPGAEVAPGPVSSFQVSIGSVCGIHFRLMWPLRGDVALELADGASAFPTPQIPDPGSDGRALGRPVLPCLGVIAMSPA